MEEKYLYEELQETLEELHTKVEIRFASTCYVTHSGNEYQFY